MMTETSESKYLSTFFITLVLFLVFIVIVYFISDFVLKEEETLKRITLSTSSNEILASNIFEVDEDDYYVIVYNSKDDALGMVSNIIQKYENEDIYLVDLAKVFNKNIISNVSNLNTSNVNDLRVTDEAIIRVEKGKNIENIDMISKYESFFE